MAYQKVILGGYIAGVGENNSGMGITETEYRNLSRILSDIPAAPDGCQYKLRADTLEWELAALPPAEPEPLTDEQALTRYANELTGADDPDLISAAETMITERIKEDT